MSVDVPLVKTMVVSIWPEGLATGRAFIKYVELLGLFMVTFEPTISKAQLYSTLSPYAILGTWLGVVYPLSIIETLLSNINLMLPTLGITLAFKGIV